MASIDEKKCIGCGACAAVCDKAFQIVDGKAKLRDEKSECIKDAAEACPVDAITP